MFRWFPENWVHSKLCFGKVESQRLRLALWLEWLPTRTQYKYLYIPLYIWSPIKIWHVSSNLRWEQKVIIEHIHAQVGKSFHHMKLDAYLNLTNTSDVKYIAQSFAELVDVSFLFFASFKIYMANTKVSHTVDVFFLWSSSWKRRQLCQWANRCNFVRVAAISLGFGWTFIKSLLFTQHMSYYILHVDQTWDELTFEQLFTSQKPQRHKFMLVLQYLFTL